MIIAYVVSGFANLEKEAKAVKIRQGVELLLSLERVLDQDMQNSKYWLKPPTFIGQQSNSGWKC